MKKIKSIIILALVLVIGITASGCGSKKPTLNVYNWGDYIDKSVIKDFEEEYGIKVVYDTFETNEDLYVKLKQGSSNYDVVIPSDYMIERMIREDMLVKLDKNNVPNLNKVDDQFFNLEFDPNNDYSVPYMWGTVGIIYNKTMVSDPVDSWDILWNPKYKGQIIMLDSPRDTIGITLKKLGYSLNTKNPDELEEAKKALMAQKELVRSYEVDTYKGQMIAGEAAMSLCWSGDAMLLMSENEDLAYAIPKEGTNLWFDCMAIPENAEHKVEAEIFINFMMRPDIAARNSEYIKYSTPNEAALELLPKEEVNNEFIYPKGDLTKLGEVFTDLGEYTTEYDRAWTEIKSY